MQLGGTHGRVKSLWTFVFVCLFVRDIRYSLFDVLAFISANYCLWGAIGHDAFNSTDNFDNNYDKVTITTD